MSSKVSFDEKLREVSDWWLSQGAADHLSIKKLNDEIDRFSQQEQAAKAGTDSWNPLKMLRSAWSHCVVATVLETQRSALESRRDDMAGILSKKNDEHAYDLIKARGEEDSPLGSIIQRTLAHKARAEDEHGAAVTFEQETRKILNQISETQTIIKYAKFQETLDMGANNAFSTMASHYHTKEAVTALKDFSVALKTYKELVTDHTSAKTSSIQMTDRHASNIEETSMWDLHMGLANIDIVSIFTSMKNKRELSKAQDRLETIEGQIALFCDPAREDVEIKKDTLDKIDGIYRHLKNRILADIELPPVFSEYTEKAETKPVPTPVTPSPTF